MSNIFFTSDHHFRHANIIKYCNRPFASVEEMDEALIRNWNEVVKPDDIVYYLGDFSMAFRPVETITKRLMGKKILIPGNHDFCHSFHKQSRKEGARKKWIQKYVENGWVVLPEQIDLKLEGIDFNISHLPYKIQLTTVAEKFDNWYPKNNDKWLLCGHVHEKWKIKNKMINVGVDVWDYRPVSLDEIVKLVVAKC